MNKEQFRKELEDCWDAAAKKVYVDDYGPVPNKNPSKEQYITTRLAALWNEKNVKTKEEILEKHCSNYRKYLDKDHMTLYELSINGFECFHAMEEYASQFQSKHLDDGQEGKGLVDILEIIKEKVCDKGFNTDANKQADLYLFLVDKLVQLRATTALPVADGDK